ncbi:hypothetical protein ACFY00_18550 [Kitasatospora sp. NPDC001540]|uniref:hypothetical protein n=1 Tax=Kitasatospora sp. NPDC001540 TaxID=3364014 RepID=UPI0036B4D749
MDHDDTRADRSPADRARWIADALHGPTGHRPCSNACPATATGSPSGSWSTRTPP